MIKIYVQFVEIRVENNIAELLLPNNQLLQFVKSRLLSPLPIHILPNLATVRILKYVTMSNNMNHNKITDSSKVFHHPPPLFSTKKVFYFKENSYLCMRRE